MKQIYKDRMIKQNKFIKCKLRVVQMHQFGKRTFFNSNINLSPLSKLRKQSNTDLCQSQQQPTRKQSLNTQRSLANLRKRTFSLSKFQSVQQSQICQQIRSKKPGEDELVRSLTDKIVFEKLNLHSLQMEKEFPKSKRQMAQRNYFVEAESPVKEEISLLKMILRKKQEDLILMREKQQQKLTQIDHINTKDTSDNHSSSNVIKRIKLLKKTKQYEYYDNLVHNLLHNINHTDNKVITQNPHVQKQQQNNQNSHTINKTQSTKKNRSSSLSTLNLSEREKLSSTHGNNFLSTNLRNAHGLEKKRESMVFGLSNGISDTIYEKKINSFVQFLYKVNFSNSIYVDLSFSGGSGKILTHKKTYKVFVGPGNNSQLVKSVIKRRFWLQLTTNKQQSNIIWTQDTQKEIHLKQLTIPKLEDSSNPSIEQETFPRTQFSLKHKFTKPSYSHDANKKILHPSQIDEADACYSRSYKGLKSPHPQVNLKLITNHIPNNSIIGSKKILFKLMHWYYSEIQKIDPFTYLPHTYHIIPGEKDNLGIRKFKQQQIRKKQRIWIVKPGQNTNRGNGISVATTAEIERLMQYKKFHKNGQLKTYIVQKYLKPFLYNNRKFDLRHYLLITSVNGYVKGYWYQSGYIRTSSEKFDMDQLDNQFIHLTNDAIQKNSQNYGKYEEGNKLTYSTFQRYLDNTMPHKKYDFEKQILDEMKRITTNVMKASFMFLDPQRNQRLTQGKACNFELYGMDFMIDHKFKPYLIEINANPCLQISCPLLERLIPITLQHTFRLALDPLMPPPEHYAPSKRYQLSDKILQRMKFQLIFDEKCEGKQLREKYQSCESKFELNGVELQPEEDLFEDDGVEIKDDALFDEVKE